LTKVIEFCGVAVPSGHFLGAKSESSILSVGESVEFEDDEVVARETLSSAAKAWLLPEMLVDQCKTSSDTKSET